MTTIRIMTYNVQRCRGRDGQVDPDRIRQVIGDGAPDLVALQEVDAGPGRESQLRLLAERLGMRAYGGQQAAANAFLSHQPLRGVREHDLGGGHCLRADLDVGGKRLHLFNLRLTSVSRLGQVSRLVGPEGLGSRFLACPTLVVGDFADLGWGASNVRLNLALRRAPGPLWSATFPACFPCFSRDRAYLRGDLRVVDARILRTPLARQASSHLPLILTVQIVDPRSYLRVEKMNRRMEIAPG